MKTYTIYTISYQGEVKYVGETSNFARRKREHLNRTPNSSAIPEDINTSECAIEPIKEINGKKYALKAENYYIQLYNTIENGWNRNRSGLICTGREKEWAKEYYQEHKEDRVIYNKQYYQEHQEELKVKQLDYQHEHQEEEKERRKVYYQNNKEKVCERANKYYQEHKEDRVIYNKQYYQDNEAVLREYHRRWQKANKEKVNAYHRAYRTRKKAEVVK